jgi:peptide-methionine (R)-S-oxide reductase
MMKQWVILGCLFSSLFLRCQTSTITENNNVESTDNKQDKNNLKMKNTEFEVVKSEEEWKKQLGDFSYNVMREKGTERPYSSEYETLWDSGIYVCKGCGSELFHSETKFDAGCGWPSFYQSIKKDAILEILDKSHGMIRTEIVCKKCGGHLGHVFNDGYDQPTGLRYCINGASLGFVKKPK